MNTPRHTIRVTGVLLFEGKILLVQQGTENREWSMPGGKLEPGETLSEAMVREMDEETGLKVRVTRQLYLCDKPEEHLLHITFLLEADEIDSLRLPTNEFEDTPITDIAFVEPDELPNYGYSRQWADRVIAGFPDAPCYAGLKKNIGL